ncbi:MAG: hypothetical protein KatS3mg110_1034 [Pirellulaceae bacterium]|nr:MAG: hypothetical protein KatS3mg110_1034 [Pirellulaceae bacterium]
MAKRSRTVRKVAQPAPARLTIRLFAPGMSVMHRAGLGGLAATLRSIERDYQLGNLSGDSLPGAPWIGGQPPWQIEPYSLTLDFGEPECASCYLKRLFEIAFDLRDGLIYLPGQYPDMPPPLPVRIYLQQGILLSFLQHGQSRTVAKKEGIYSYSPDDDPTATLTLSYKKCSKYKHQTGWKDLVDSKTGCLREGVIKVVGPLNPGAVVRHVAFDSRTKIEEDAARVLALYFALVGCLALPVNRGCGVLLVPEVRDLSWFAEVRPLMTPVTDRDCQITSPGDAALQIQVRLRTRQHIVVHEVPGFYVATLQPTAWAKQQKSRVRTLVVPPGDDAILGAFEIAMNSLPPHIAVTTVGKPAGRAHRNRIAAQKRCFWRKSVVRPLVADNLAQGFPWYRDLRRLMIGVDPATGRPFWNRLFFERKGLRAMADNLLRQNTGEATVVKAVHEAIRQRYGQIASENRGNPAAMKNRWAGEYDRWRLAFAGAKTAEQFRRALCDLFSRGGSNRVLKEHWPELLPMLDASQWQLTRDLALLALASYSGAGEKELEELRAEEPVESDADQ